MFIILSGSSGVGKNTVMNALLEKNNLIKKFKTCTTRQVRPEEMNDSVYIHLTKEEFNKKLKNNEFFEYEEIHGNLYGTLNESVELLKQNKCHYVKDIGVEGQQSFKNKLPKDIKVISIFLYAPKEVLIERLQNRGEQEIEKRMQRFDYENAQMHNFDYIINNEDLNKTVEKIEQIILECK